MAVRVRRFASLCSYKRNKGSRSFFVALGIKKLKTNIIILGATLERMTFSTGVSHLNHRT